MTVAELGLAPKGAVRLQGRAANPVQASYAGDLGESDIALLASERGTQPNLIRRLRDRHHSLARALASNCTDTEASAITGYDPSRISILKRDPTFKALMDDYRTVDNAALADFQDRAVTLAVTSVNLLQERLDNEDEPVSESMLLEIAKFAADRTGNGPVSKTSNVNVNVDLGNRLAAARRRVEAVPALIAPPPVDVDFQELG